MKPINADRFPKYIMIFLTFFWLMSISIQPLVFICLLILFVAILSIKPNSKQMRGLLLSLIFGLLVFLPFAAYVFKHSSQHVLIRPIDEAMERLLTAQSFIVRLFSYNGYFKVITIQMLGISLLSLIVSRYKVVLLCWVSFGVLYFCSIFIFLAIGINWFIHTKYLLTVLPIFYMGFLLSLFFIYDKKYITTKTIYLSLIAGIAVLSYSKFDLAKPIRHNWKGLFALLDQSTQTNDAEAFMYPFFKSSHWPDDIFVANGYYKLNKLKVVEMKSFNIPTHVPNEYLFKKFQIKKSEELFLVMLKDSVDPNFFNLLDIKNSQKIDFDIFYVLHLNGPVLETAKSLYSEFLKYSSEPNVLLFAYDGLFLASLHDRNCTEANLFLNKFSNLAKSIDIKFEPWIIRKQKWYTERCEVITF